MQLASLTSETLSKLKLFTNEPQDAETSVSEFCQA